MAETLTGTSMWEGGGATWAESTSSGAGERAGGSRVIEPPPRWTGRAAAPERLPNLEADGPLTLDAFDLGVTLGTGSFGRVRLCTHKVSRGGWAVMQEEFMASVMAWLCPIASIIIRLVRACDWCVCVVVAGYGNNVGDQDAQEGRGHPPPTGEVRSGEKLSRIFYLA
jgi:hypothetical protein